MMLYPLLEPRYEHAPLDSVAITCTSDLSGATSHSTVVSSVAIETGVE